MMRIALIADAFPPMTSSAAVQIRDLSQEFSRQGHSICLILPSSDQNRIYSIEFIEGVQVLRLKAPRTKGISYFWRLIAECSMPFSMLKNFKKSPLANATWDAVIWYSPSIFHGLFVQSIKKKGCPKSYLIVRDIFPEWALDLGLLRPGLLYIFFTAVARYQYSVANIIGIQTSGNRKYFQEWLKAPNRRVEVLNNWLADPVIEHCPIRVRQTRLKGRKIFVYAGNMGVAQNVDIFLDLAEKMIDRVNIGFLFVGRGTEVQRLKNSAHARCLKNVLFFEEILPNQIPDLYSQCTAGIVSLDKKHKSHNIPGKFLTYMQSGLPVLANINKGNDLVELIKTEKVGQVCESSDITELLVLADKLLAQTNIDVNLSARCKSLFQKQFSVEKVVKQISLALSEK